ncbi:venom metalloproteinase 3-like [Microplitis mediator]|uniref:venom metalloproteinase 3-like n=1 Tax=Microplitis mediator TaxID=375433 RepID=UPI002555A1AD|nr:venom metalloproteinase 3-like [Microplitis mediator]
MDLIVYCLVCVDYVKEKKCDIINVEWPHLQKRSIDNGVLFSLTIFGKRIDLNLIPSKNSLVRSNTPVYFLDTEYDFLRLKVKTHEFIKEHWQLYEDINALTSIYVKTYSDGSKKIEFGYLGNEHLTIESLRHNFDDSNKNYYLARSSDETNETIKMFDKNSSHEYEHKNLQSIPDKVYPELLLIIDYGVYIKYHEKQQLFPYLSTFWSIVNMIYRPLKNPEFKISFAGIMIAQDSKVIHRMNKDNYQSQETSRLNYEKVSLNVSEYLYSKQIIIPKESFDVFIIITTKKYSGDNEDSITLGLAVNGGACKENTKKKQLDRSIIFCEGSHINDINIATHELAHSFGVQHDKDISNHCVIHNSVLSTNSKKLNRNWSNCSTNTLTQNLRNSKFSCLYNKPDDRKSSLNYESFDNDTDNSNGKWLEFYMTINDGERAFINRNEFVRNSIIEVSYANTKTIVKQIDVSHENSFSGAKRIYPDYRLQKMELDDRKIIIDLRIVNPTKSINIYHKEEYIFAYQDKEPVMILNGQILPHYHTLPPLYIAAGEDDELIFKINDFDVNRLVAVYWENNTLIVTQLITEDDDINQNRHDLIDLNLKSAVSDSMKRKMWKSFYLLYKCNKDRIERPLERKKEKVKTVPESHASFWDLVLSDLK